MNQFLVLFVLTSLTSSFPQDLNLNDENDVEYNLTTNFFETTTDMKTIEEDPIKFNKSKELNFLSALSRSTNFTTDDTIKISSNSTQIDNLNEDPFKTEFEDILLNDLNDSDIEMSTENFKFIDEVTNTISEKPNDEISNIEKINEIKTLQSDLNATSGAINDSLIEISSRFSDIDTSVFENDTKESKIDEIKNSNTISEKPNDEILSNIEEINEIKTLQSDLNATSGAINDSLIEISSRFSDIDTSVFEYDTKESKIDEIKNSNITEEDFVNEERYEETTQDFVETEHDCSLFNEEKSTDKLINKKLEKSGRSLNGDIGALPAVLSESFTLSPHHLFTRFKLNFYNFENSDKSNLIKAETLNEPSVSNDQINSEINNEPYNSESNYFKHELQLYPLFRYN